MIKVELRAEDTAEALAVVLHAQAYTQGLEVGERPRILDDAHSAIGPAPKPEDHGCRVKALEAELLAHAAGQRRVEEHHVFHILVGQVATEQRVVGPNDSKLRDGPVTVHTRDHQSQLIATDDDTAELPRHSILILRIVAEDVVGTPIGGGPACELCNWEHLR